MQYIAPYIVGVGHCCKDYLCVVEQYPSEDGSTHILSIDDSHGGGAVATAMVAAVRIGMPSAMIANLGDDAVGDAILHELTQEQVSIEGISRIPGGRSSTSYIMVNPATGSRTKFPYRDNLPSIVFDVLKQALIQHAAILHLDGTQYENALNAAKLAKAAGVTISLDGCSMQADRAANLALAGFADLLIMNARYPLCVSGEQDIASALRHIAEHTSARVILSTQGANGCWAWINGQAQHFDAFPIHAVDTTGAGDVFHGAFLVAWAEGQPLPDCIRFASAASAMKCLQSGGRQGIPSRKELDRFLAEHHQA